VPSPIPFSPQEAALVFAAFIPGFRTDRHGRYRGPAIHRNGHNPTALAVDVERGVWHDFVTGDGGDCISFVMLSAGSGFKDACRLIGEIIGRDVLEPSAPAKPKLSAADLVRAELFKVGFQWELERHLALLKEAHWSGLLEDPTVIAQVTHLLSRVNSWTVYEVADFMVEFERRRPVFVRDCIEETRHAQLNLARSICSWTR
jgi:hypothetical protein